MQNSCNILLSTALFLKRTLFVYKLQFRGLQPFRVRYDDHCLLIFVVVNTALQKTSVGVNRGEKDAASWEGTESQTCPVFEDRETSAFFLAHVTLLRKSLVLVWTTKSSLIIHWGFSPCMRVVGLLLFADLKWLPQNISFLQRLPAQVL